VGVTICVGKKGPEIYSPLDFKIKIQEKKEVYQILIIKIKSS
jgi:hypothetical protein